MNTLFDLDTLETKAQAQQHQPAIEKARYWIEVSSWDGQRAAYIGSRGDEVLYMIIRPGKKQRQPKLYKTQRGAELSARDLGGGIVRAWTGSYEVQS